ncbi:MAG: hypothetical protein QW331_04805 [Candidatus Woesearchaeota archaeon]
MTIITINTAFDSKEKIKKAIEELQKVLQQKEKFHAWKPKPKTSKGPSADQLLKEVDKIPLTAAEKRELEQIKNRPKLETY